MVEHELLEEYERHYPRSKKVWQEIDRRLKVLDAIYKDNLSDIPFDDWLDVWAKELIE